MNDIIWDTILVTFFINKILHIIEIFEPSFQSIARLRRESMETSLIMIRVD